MRRWMRGGTAGGEAGRHGGAEVANGGACADGDGEHLRRGTDWGRSQSARDLGTGRTAESGALCRVGENDGGLRGPAGLGPMSAKIKHISSKMFRKRVSRLSSGRQKQGRLSLT